MYEEAGQSAKVVREQLIANQELMIELGELLRRMRPLAVVTIGRGSSDHAATFAQYLFETRLGVVASSSAPSVSSVFGAAPDMAGMVCIAISQSGKSPDLLAAVERAQSAGAFVIAFVNDVESPLAKLAERVAPLGAGKELSVAATKSFIASLSAITHLVASWAQDVTLMEALQGLPDLLDQAWSCDWSAAIEVLRGATNLYTVGRGVGFGAALEIALKFKETCGLHAEAFSAAEVQHGPMALVGPGFPVLALAQGDQSRPGIDALVETFVARGARVLLARDGRAGPDPRSVLRLPSVAADPVLEPILYVQSAYRMLNALSLVRGFDPDRPPFLNKITETV
jgi:glucosamine--fructose-6-phosphate aminotransferase (isomerizing)